MTDSDQIDMFLTATPDDVEQGITREFRKRPPIFEDVEAAAVAMIAVRPVLEAKDDEITRLQAGIGEGVKAAMASAAGALDEGFGEIEAATRAAERQRLIGWLRERAGIMDPIGTVVLLEVAGELEAGVTE